MYIKFCGDFEQMDSWYRAGYGWPSSYDLRARMKVEVSCIEWT